MRDDLPNQIHMFLCAAIPLATFFALRALVSPAIALVASILSALVVMFAGTPLTAWIYRRIRSKYGTLQQDAVVHTTDAGCASIIFLFLFFTLWPQLERVLWPE